MSKSKVRLFIDDKCLFVNKHIVLHKKQSHYLNNVMRLGNGDELVVFNGQDGEWLACIYNLNKNSITLAIVREIRKQYVAPRVHLCFSIIKHSALNFLIEKATELGVSDLHPIITDRTVVRKFNAGRCMANVTEASEQCERLTIPQVHAVKTISQLLQCLNDNEQLYYCAERNHSAAKIGSINRDVVPYFLVGPEGGFTKEECILLDNNSSSSPITLGSNILRAETAAIAVLAKYFL